MMACRAGPLLISSKSATNADSLQGPWAVAAQATSQSCPTPPSIQTLGGVALGEALGDVGNVVGEALGEALGDVLGEAVGRTRFV